MAEGTAFFVPYLALHFFFRCSFLHGPCESTHKFRNYSLHSLVVFVHLVS